LNEIHPSDRIAVYGNMALLLSSGVIKISSADDRGPRNEHQTLLDSGIQTG